MIGDVLDRHRLPPPPRRLLRPLVRAFGVEGAARAAKALYSQDDDVGACSMASTTWCIARRCARNRSKDAADGV